jgi:hypothetical protein
MPLTPEEKIRKNELLNKYNKYGYLEPYEVQELEYLISKDDSLDDSIKYLLIFALGALFMYALLKRGR